MANNGAEDLLGLTAAQMNLLAAQAEYSVEQNVQMFKEFLA